MAVGTSCSSESAMNRSTVSRPKRAGELVFEIRGGATYEVLLVEGERVEMWAVHGRSILGLRRLER